MRYNVVCAAPRQIPEIFRALSPDKTASHAELCEFFDAETRNGEDISRCCGLPDKTIAAITAQFERKNAGNLVPVAAANSWISPGR